MRCRAFYLFFLLCFSQVRPIAQTLGGDAAYGFLRLGLHPASGALGGRNVSLIKGDPGILSENPALLDKAHHGQVSSHFSFLAPSVVGTYATGSVFHQKSKTVFALGITQLFYGTEMQTDASGNVMGSFRAFDQMVGLTLSRNYGRRWQYGVTMKFIHSRYGAYASMGLAADAGLVYYDEENKVKLGFAAKNMGAQLKTYSGQPEDLPFDLVLGMTKEMKEAPFRLSLTAQRIHQFDLLYNDTVFYRDNYASAMNTGFVNKLFSHLVAGAEILVGERIVLSGGYNFLRRRELRIRNTASGLSGFSYGISLHMQRLRFQFARSHYQTSLSQNQISISYALKPPQAQ